MIYNDFKDLSLSRLGLGCMRLPVKADGTIDEELSAKMVAYCFEHGINYFDTAYPYHQGMSEIVIGKILKQYPRDKFYLATKFPGHQISESYDAKMIFETQLKKCQVDYFDFYLLHNVYEKSVETFTSEKWGIIDYLLEQKKNGRIKHLGFSCHGRLDLLKDFLVKYGDKMEFCQLQINYLDWTLQEAKEKYELVTSYNIPVWVMEPVRGGKLIKLTKSQREGLFKFDEKASIASYAFRFLLDLPNVKMILSGMSNMEQLMDNVHTFENYVPLSKEEKQYLFDMAEEMKNSVPCTACKYCVAGCPKKLDIPKLIALFNDFKFDKDGEGALTSSMQMDALEESKRPAACIKCGACKNICPQHIDVPKVMGDLEEFYENYPKWAETSKKREAIAREIEKKMKKD